MPSSSGSDVSSSIAYVSTFRWYTRKHPADPRLAAKPRFH
jgi:hypothetical protein